METSGDKTKGYFLVAFSGILFGCIIFGGKVFSNLGLSLIEISTLPYVFTLLFLFPFIIQKKYWANKKNWLILIIYGVIGGCATVSQFAGIVFGASVAVVVLLLYSQPLWTTIISFLFLKEKINKYQIVACCLVILGVIFLVNPSELFASKSFLGVVSALVGGIFLSLWVVGGSVTSKRKINPITIKYFETTFGLLFIALFFPIMLFFSSDPGIVHFSLDHSSVVWALLIGFNLFVVTIGHMVYFYGSRFIPTTSSGIILLLEPITGVLLSVIFLSQPLTIGIVIGGALILLGNVLVITKG
ncbi:MAG: DMT family transporter [archaeon]|jgi:drug/metabolite transporter (DMT)-like permease